MKKLIIFEQRKFWYNHKTFVVLLLMVVGLVGMVVFNTVQDKAYWDGEVLKLENERNMVWNIRATYQDQVLIERRRGGEQEVIAELRKIEMIYRDQYLLTVRELTLARNLARGKITAQDMFELYVERDTHLLWMLEEGYDFLGTSAEDVQLRLMNNQYILEQGVKPLNSPYQMTATNFLYQLLSYPWILIVILSISLLVIDIFSGETETGAYKVLYSQPFGRGLTHGAKFLVNFTNSFITVTLVIIFAFGVVALINGLGETSYPTLYFADSYNSILTKAAGASADTFLPWSDYLIRILPLYGILCCFIMAFIGTVSLIMSTTSNVLNALICFLILDYSTRVLFARDSFFFVLWPFTTAGTDMVLRGNFLLTASGYLVLLGLMTSSLLLASLVILNKRDMTGGMGS